MALTCTAAANHSMGVKTHLRCLTKNRYHVIYWQCMLGPPVHRHLPARPSQSHVMGPKLCCVQHDACLSPLGRAGRQVHGSLRLSCTPHRYIDKVAEITLRSPAIIQAHAMLCMCVPVLAP